MAWYDDLRTRVIAPAGSSATITRFIRGGATYKQACNTCQPQGECIACRNDQTAEQFAVIKSGFQDVDESTCAATLNGTHTIQIAQQLHVRPSRGPNKHYSRFGNTGSYCMGDYASTCMGRAVQYLCKTPTVGEGCGLCTEVNTWGTPMTGENPILRSEMRIYLILGGGVMFEPRAGLTGAPKIGATGLVSIQRGVSVILWNRLRKLCGSPTLPSIAYQYAIYTLPINSDIWCEQLNSLYLPLARLSDHDADHSNPDYRTIIPWKYEEGTVRVTSMSNTTFLRPQADADASASIGGVDVS